MSRSLSILLATAMLLVGSLATAGAATAATIAPTTTCNNGLGNGGAVCEVTVVNTITPTGGSAVVTVRECTGSAGVPDATCTNTTSPLTEPVTAVTQCNGSINGGDGTLLCSVNVTNNFVGFSPAPSVDAVTVNQCVGSGGGGGATVVCTPFPATTSGATIIQCNGTANEGGASLTCTASGTQSSGLAVLINQCNGSSNGGGTRTVCTATMTNNVVAAPTPTPSPTPSGSPTAGPSLTARPTAGATPPHTDTRGTTKVAQGEPLPVVFAAIFSLAFVASMAGVAGRRSLRGARNR